MPLTAFQAEVLSLGAKVMFPLCGQDPYRDMVSGVQLTGAPTMRQISIGGGQTASTAPAAEEKTGTLTHLNGLDTVTLLGWLFRTGAGGWADGYCIFGLDFLNATGRGVEFSARTASTGLEAVKSSSGTAYWQRTTTTALPTGRWGLVGLTTALNTGAGTAPDIIVDGVVVTGAGANNGFTAGTMDASVAARFGNFQGNLARDFVLIPRVLSSLELARLGKLNPLR